MFNFALGWAFLLSALASPGGQLVAILFEPAALRNEAPFKAILASIFANYWIPALVIYLALKLVRAQRYLRASTGLHIVFGLSNGVLCLYAVLRVFTSTIQGGGATFMLAGIGVFATVPALILLGVGTVWLVVRSAPRRSETVIVEKSPLRSAGTTAALVALVPPIAYLTWLYAEHSEQFAKAGADRKIRETRLKELCGSVRFDARRPATPAKSVLFAPHITNATYPLVGRLDFVEMQKLPPLQAGKTAFERLTRKPNEPVIVKGLPNPNIARRDIEVLEAEFEIIAVPIGSKTDTAMQIGVQETTIKDRRTNNVVAVFTSVGETTTVAKPGEVFCPKSFEGLSSYQLAATSYALGLMDDTAAKEFEAQLAAAKVVGPPSR